MKTGEIKEEKKKEKRKRKVLIILIILMLLIFFTLLIKFIPSFLPFYQKEVDISLKVGNYTGIDINTSTLSFGTAMKSATVSREVIITNEYPDKITAKLSVLGDLSRWTEISERNFILGSNESRNVEVNIKVPEDAKIGNYSGKLRISFTR